MLVEPYLFFNGCCEEALEFYRNALGAEVSMLMRYKDSPEPPPPGMVPPGFEDKVMHANLRIGDSMLMAADDCQGNLGFQGFSLSISAPDTDKAATMFAALAEGGQVRMPLSETFFASRFGMVSDRFGVGWMVIVEKQ